MDAQTILSALADPAVAFSMAEIDDAFRLLKARRGANAQLVVNALKRGDMVAFEARGRLQVGTVERVNQKTVSVRVGGVGWRVDGSFVRKATPAEIEAAATAASAPLSPAELRRFAAADALAEARAEARAS